MAATHEVLNNRRRSSTALCLRIDPLCRTRSRATREWARAELSALGARLGSAEGGGMGACREHLTPQLRTFDRSGASHR